MPTKQKFTDLDDDVQARVLKNEQIPFFETALLTAMASGSNEAVAEVTAAYNEARGLPVEGIDQDASNRETGGTPGTTGKDQSTGIDRYDEMTKPDLQEEADSRGIADDIQGTGKDGYVTADDLRHALRADDDPQTGEVAS